MIIRSFAVRAGRQPLARNTLRPLRRFLSSDVETSAENSLKQLQALESQLNAHLHQPVSSLDPETDATVDTTTAPSQLVQSIAEQYHLHKQQQQLSGKLGSDISPHYQPHTLLSNPPSPADVTLELLLASEAHQGHATSLWNPANARYIHGIRQGTHIISLEVTAAHLRRASKVVQQVCRNAGIVLFVGTRDGQDTAVVRAAQLAKGYHLFERWIPGSITNGQQILGKCRTKVLNHLDEEVPGFEEQLFDRPVLRPDLVVCLNPLENYVLLHECALNQIPTIGVIDTNADPTWVTYPIPANDDSLRCIQVIAGVLGRAGETGQKQRLRHADETGEAVYPRASGLTLPEQLDDGTAAPSEVQSDSNDVLSAKGDIVDERELAAKLEDANNRDGRRLGHRIKASS